MPKSKAKEKKLKSPIPKGLTEAEVLEGIELIVINLAPKFKYPQFTSEDICQQARYFAWEAVGRFRADRIIPSKTNKSKKEVLVDGLKSFIYRHVRNRLINYIRDNLGRSPGRQNLSYALPLDVVDDHDERSMAVHTDVSAELQAQELHCYILANVPDDIRSDYRKLIANETIPRNRRQQIRDIVQQILDDMPEEKDASQE